MFTLFIFLYGSNHFTRKITMFKALFILFLYWMKIFYGLHAYICKKVMIKWLQLLTYYSNIIIAQQGTSSHSKNLEYICQQRNQIVICLLLQDQDCIRITNSIDWFQHFQLPMWITSFCKDFSFNSNQEQSVKNYTQVHYKVAFLND